mmetsp:Transcript_88932/g.237063  ORF Transcript_88932/g.237063 Transcript_88932/m.237063 type:complete len:120 (-) Transcript_88932:435-794(-)
MVGRCAGVEHEPGAVVGAGGHGARVGRACSLVQHKSVPSPAFACSDHVSAENPNVLPPGVLLRLGPVVPLRAKTSLQTLARRFRTTVAALLAANRDLDAASSTVPAGQAVCVLPDVCAS